MKSHRLMALVGLLAALSLPLVATAGEGAFGVGRDDPALVTILDRFGQDLEAQTPALDARTRDRVALAALIAVNAPTAFRARLEQALDGGMSPAEAKEILYHAVPYVGVGRVAECLREANAFLRERGVALPLPDAATVTAETRFDRGLAIQVETFGEGFRTALTSGPEDLRPVRRNLAANCFGDFYTRRGLDMQARELLTYSMLIALGGCEAQVRGHINGNLAVGNGRATLIQATLSLIPIIGYPRTLNALAAIDELTRKEP